jgi:hypothetical protein
VSQSLALDINPPALDDGVVSTGPETRPVAAASPATAAAQIRATDAVFAKQSLLNDDHQSSLDTLLSPLGSMSPSAEMIGTALSK